MNQSINQSLIFNSHAMGHLFGKGIFVSNGEGWRWQRKTASHIFSVANFRDHFTDVFVKELHAMCDNIFDKKASNHRPVDFHDVMFKFTLDSFVLLGFGKQLDSLSNRGKVPFAESFDICQADCFDRFINPFIPVAEAIRAITPGKKTIRDHLNIVNEFAYSIITERRQQLANGEEFKDLLSRFMSTQNEHGEPLSDSELRDTVLNFIIAGRDTTAQALSWTFYNLTLHPRIEAKLVEEIQACIREEHEQDSPALYEAIKKMTYAHAVFYEVLRLYPSVPVNTKVALEDDIWPDGTQVKKGDTIVWSTYALGRSTKVWGPDAKEFKPERWITPNGELRRESQGQFPAFHVGPRVCLGKFWLVLSYMQPLNILFFISGQNLATLEALVAIVLLLKRYKFTLVPNQEITYKVSLTMPMRNGMKLFVEKR
ncbi:cytochrome p450 [Lichtheimia corymbifera JMRC:FSU:9682]|uniref:Cytochrome p450 n=1 Tax=Lichtheimia corymbifera JMRC:FSU:9682 TaxID=1263082 RepID=A0A068S299_9FUNG|nr:cytochrome p450 [Lichtheimia corymbifera JMRC:FSU:9682]